MAVNGRPAIFAAAFAVSFLALFLGYIQYLYYHSIVGESAPLPISLLFYAGCCLSIILLTPHIIGLIVVAVRGH